MPSRLFSIPKTEFQARLERTKDRTRELGYVGLLTVSGYAERDGNVCYLCGHKNAFPYSMRTEFVSGLGYSAFLVPTEEKETTLVAPLGYQADAVVGVGRSKTGTDFAVDLVDAVRESSLDKSKLVLVGSDILPAVQVKQPEQ